MNWGQSLRERVEGSPFGDWMDSYEKSLRGPTSKGFTEEIAPWFTSDGQLSAEGRQHYQNEAYRARTRHDDLVNAARQSRQRTYRRTTVWFSICAVVIASIALLRDGAVWYTLAAALVCAGISALRVRGAILRCQQEERYAGSARHLDLNDIDCEIQWGSYWIALSESERRLVRRRKVTGSVAIGVVATPVFAVWGGMKLLRLSEMFGNI